jgi:hypothetical protein
VVNPAGGIQSQTPILIKGVTRIEVPPCPEPKGCVSPGETTCDEDFPITIWHDLGPYIDELLGANPSEVNFVLDVRSELPSGIVNWKRGLFQVNFSSATLEEANERGKELSGEPQPDEEISTHSWIYQWWENEKSENQKDMSEGEAPLPPQLPPFDALLHQKEKKREQDWGSSFDVSTEQDFEKSKDEAFKYYRLFTDVVAKIDDPGAREWWKRKKDLFETILKWFQDEWPIRGEKWPPFPLSGRGPRRPVGIGGILKLKCPKCWYRWSRPSKWWTDEEGFKHPDYDVKEQLCPNPKNPPDSTHIKELIRPIVISNGWRNEISAIASDALEISDSLRDKIRDKMDDPYSVPLFAVNFKLAKPKQIDETESDVLPRPAQLKEVAEKLKEHLEFLDKARVERVMKVRGYADSSGSCSLNVNLSKMRADWVVNKLKNEYNLQLQPATNGSSPTPTPSPTSAEQTPDQGATSTPSSTSTASSTPIPMPTPVKTFGCGKAFSGNTQFKELWENEKTQRQTSGDQPVDENEAERLVVIELCPPEKKRSS